MPRATGACTYGNCSVIQVGQKFEVGAPFSERAPPRCRETGSASAHLICVRMMLATARRGGALFVAGRRTLLLANVASRNSNAVAVLPRQFSSPSMKSRERSEFKEAKLPVDNIEFKETGILTTIDRLSNIMFMAEIFRALWLSAEVCFGQPRIACFLPNPAF